MAAEHSLEFFGSAPACCHGGSERSNDNSSRDGRTASLGWDSSQRCMVRGVEPEGCLNCWFWRQKGSINVFSYILMVVCFRFFTNKKGEKRLSWFTLFLLWSQLFLQVLSSFEWKCYPLLHTLSDFRFVLLEKERNARAYVSFTSLDTTAHLGLPAAWMLLFWLRFACMPFWALLCAFARILPLID